MSVIELSKIAGISTFNARQTADDDIACTEMCDSIREKGVTQALVVRLEDGQYRVLDGGRRLQALLRLRDEGDFKEFNVPVAIFEGCDEDAAELSLISFVQRRDLHPVDEFERFVELRDRFTLDEEAIAKRTGKSLRFIKQRLRLARLAPSVREAWRNGELTAERAQAFSVTDNIEAQEALLADDNKRHWNAANIGKYLRGEGAIASCDRRAALVGLDAYVAAGGRLDEQLFDDESYLLDEAILDKLAKARLEAEGERICRDEGWGWFATPYSNPDSSNHFHFFYNPDYLTEERARLDEIESALDDIDDDGEIAAFQKEVSEIEARAVLRAVSLGDRATLGVYLDYAADNPSAIDVSRALRQRERPSRDAANAGAGAGAGDKASRRVASPPSATADGEEIIETFGKSTRAILDEAATGALYETIARNPRLALVFAVAALGCQYGGEALTLKSEEWRSQEDLNSALLKEIEELPFDEALAICARVETEDPSQTPIAFAELVARNIHPAQGASFDATRILIAAASRFCDIHGALKRGLAQSDGYENYFKSEARGASIEAIRAIDGEAAAAEAAKLKKPELAKRAALLAKDRGWIPHALSAALAAPRDERSTAQAMRDAIEADEASGRSGPERAQEDLASGRSGPERAQNESEAGDAIDKLTRVETFLELDCHRGNDALDAGRIKASELYAAFVEFCEARELEPLSLQAFAAAIAALGIEKKRLKTGVHYLNLALRAPQDRAA